MLPRRIALVSLLGLAGCQWIGGPRCKAGVGPFGLTADCEKTGLFSSCKLESRGYGPAGDVAITAKVVATGLKTPWAIAWPGDGDLLVTERSGAIRRVKADGTLVPAPVATVPIADSGEGGLLGMALHPQFAANRWIYLYYTGETAGLPVNRVERWRLSADGASAAADKVIVDGIPALQFHNGGRLRFGPDGKLYVGTGDAGTPTLAQDPFSLAGKILRVNDDGSVPDDNPFPGSRTWIYGIRNTQGFDWIAPDRMVVTDHGPTGLPQEGAREGHDEISVGGKGANLGWPIVYGCESLPGYVAPSMSWADPMPPGGTAIYTGTEIPEWRGDVFVGVLGFAEDVPHLHRIRLERDKVTISETYLQGARGYGRLRDVIMGPDGALYATTSECDGRGSCTSGDKILRIGRTP